MSKLLQHLLLNIQQEERFVNLEWYHAVWRTERRYRHLPTTRPFADCLCLCAYGSIFISWSWLRCAPPDFSSTPPPASASSLISYVPYPSQHPHASRSCRELVGNDCKILRRKWRKLWFPGRWRALLGLWGGSLFLLSDLTVICDTMATGI